MTEFPLIEGDLLKRAVYNELADEINTRRFYHIPDRTAAFTIYNSAADATSATAELTSIILGDAATTATVDKSLTDVGKFTGYTLDGKKCRIWASTGGNTGLFTIVSNTDDKLTFTNDPGNGTAVQYYTTSFLSGLSLIVVGGADASNITFDLSTAAYDTITELVAAINALGFSWVAVEKSGSQSTVGNESDTLFPTSYSEDIFNEPIPATCNVLGEKRLLWIANYRGIFIEDRYLVCIPYGALIKGVTGSFKFFNWNYGLFRQIIDDMAYLFYQDNQGGNTGATIQWPEDTLTDVGAFTGRDLTGYKCTILSPYNKRRTVNIYSNDNNILDIDDFGEDVEDVVYHIGKDPHTPTTMHQAAFAEDDWKPSAAEGTTAITTTGPPKTLTDAGKFVAYNFVEDPGGWCVITASTGGNTGRFAIAHNTDDVLTFNVDPGNGTNVEYYIEPNLLKPPSLMHKRIWNDMKACLDVLVW